MTYQDSLLGAGSLARLWIPDVLAMDRALAGVGVCVYAVKEVCF